MAHNGAAERWLAWEVGQTSMIDECFGANDGIVPPIITIAKMPVGQAGGKDGSIDAGRKLVGTRKEGLPIHHERQGLDETCITRGFHRSDELDECLACHQTVRIQHHHVIILGSPALAKISDIPRFASNVFETVPVEDVPLPLGTST